MPKGILIKGILALACGLFMPATAAKGQIFTAPLQASTTGTDPVDFEFRADGTLIAKGNPYVGCLLSSDQGAGVRMLWYPAKGAFREGGVDGTQWDECEIGLGSVAMGYNSRASGLCSVALGQNADVGADNAVGIGDTTHSYGLNSQAFGTYVVSWGYASTVIGFDSSATGDSSVAIGYFATATGRCSMSFGNVTTASGEFGMAMGSNTLADSYSSFTVGSYNVGGGDPGCWVPTDPCLKSATGTRPLRRTP